VPTSARKFLFMIYLWLSRLVILPNVMAVFWFDLTWLLNLEIHIVDTVLFLIIVRQSIFLSFPSNTSYSFCLWWFILFSFVFSQKTEIYLARGDPLFFFLLKYFTFWYISGNSLCWCDLHGRDSLNQGISFDRRDAIFIGFSQ